jgi:c-di-GMP-binding flagellar brake protein YcgR
MTDSSTQVRPEPETPGSEQFTTHSRREIIDVLEDIVERGALVTLFFAQGDEFFVTNLLHVNPEFEELVFDRAPGEAMSERLLQSSRMTFVTLVEQIKVQFTAQHAEPTSFDGKPALRIRLPDSLMRLQRRNFYRVPAVKSAPLICEIPLSGGAPARFSIGDISVGGVAVIAGPVTAEIRHGAVFHNCSIALPGHGSFTVSLEIRNNIGVAMHAKEPVGQRYGCQFLNLEGPVLSLLQRYINQLERNRRSLI